eukprot:jgi/Antlo1/617/2404
MDRKSTFQRTESNLLAGNGQNKKFCRVCSRKGKYLP